MSSSVALPFLTALCWLLTSAAAEKILLAPMLYGSHVVENLHLGEALIARGHEVHLLLPKVSKYNAMVSKSRVKPLTFDTPDDIVLMESNYMTELIYNVTFYELDGMAVIGEAYTKISSDYCHAFMHDDALLASVRKHAFDLAIVGAVQPVLCLFLLPHTMNVPYIAMTSMHSPWTTGIPALPSFTNNMFAANFGPLSMWDKLVSAAWQHYLTQDSTTMLPRIDLLKEFEPQMTSWWTLYKRSRIFLVYRDHMLDDPAPSMPNLIQTPALSYSDAKPLEPELAAKMTSSKTVIVSFGSVANTLPADVAHKFIDAFSQLSGYNIVWRLKNRDNLPLPGHVHLLDWLPQNDLLGHNTTRLFIAHCGAGGVYEALYHAVPILCFPLFAEQEHNAVVVVQHNSGA